MFWLSSESVYIGYSIEELEKIKNRLTQEGIAYRCRVLSHAAQWGAIGTKRGAFGSAGLNQSYEKQYELLVKSKDYSRAKQLISNR